ncbi:MAG: pitrilysin family protein [Acidobacteriota bacterium]
MGAPTAPLDRSVPPTLAAPMPYALPSFHRATLSNGMQMLVLPVARVPLLMLEVMSHAGADVDARAQAGRASLATALLDEGTESRSALEIAAVAERLGGFVGTGLDWDIALVRTVLLARHLDRGMDLLAEIVRTPTFPDDEIERQRQQRLGELLRRRDQPQLLARLALMQALYPSDHPYHGSVLGTPTTVETLDRAVLRSHYANHIASPANAVLLAVGDIAPEAAIAAAERGFGDWQPSADARPPQPPPPMPKASPRRVIVVDRPGAPQTQLFLGQIGVARSAATAADHPARVLMNGLLGGLFTSRINLNLREQRGYTYGASSAFAQRRGPGPFTVGAALTTENTGDAIEQVLHEITRMRETPVSADELEEARRYLVGSFPHTVQRLDGLRGRLAALVAYGLPDDYYDTYPACILDLDAETVRAATRTHVEPEALTIVAAGPAALLTPQLASFGDVEVWDAARAVDPLAAGDARA